MLSKLKNVILAMTALFVIAAPVAVPAAVYADNISDGICQGVGATSTTGGNSLSGNGSGACNSPDTSNASAQLQKIITTVINIFSIIVGVVAVIMIIVGGLRYITSGGESSNVSSAKNTIIYAIVGLVIVALAQFIVHFVLGKVNGIS